MALYYRTSPIFPSGLQLWKTWRELMAFRKWNLPCWLLSWSQSRSSARQMIYRSDVIELMYCIWFPSPAFISLGFKRALKRIVLTCQQKPTDVSAVQISRARVGPLQWMDLSLPRLADLGLSSPHNQAIGGSWCCCCGLWGPESHHGTNLCFSK